LANLPTRLDYKTHYKDMKGNAKGRKWGELGLLRVTHGYWK